jgi:anti-sigma regulatory factor (Ser/Thr protein kinase)
VIVIATEAHRRAFARQLAAVGAGPLAVGDRAVVWLDAAEVLASFMPAGRIDGEAFHREVGCTIAKASALGGPVCVYGEMVQLLWDAGNVVAALDLEGMWTEVIGEHRCSLMCAYRSSSVFGAEHSEALQRVCELHSSIFQAPEAEIVAQFLPEPDAPRAARRFVADTLRRSGHPALVEDAQLTVSELATNAVIHARTAFSVAVQSSQPGVRLSVRDGSRHRPVIRDPVSNALGGRGLRLVAAIAADWGTEITAQGKTVWAQLAPNSSPARLRGLSVRAGQSERSELYRWVADTLEHSADLLERRTRYEQRNDRQVATDVGLQRAKRARATARRARDLASRIR